MKILDVSVASNKTLVQPDGSRVKVPAHDVLVQGEFNAKRYGPSQFLIEVADEGIVNAVSERDRPLGLTLVKKALQQVLDEADELSIIRKRICPDSLQYKTVTPYGGETGNYLTHTPAVMLLES